MVNLGIIAVITYILVVGIILIVTKKRPKADGSYYRMLVFTGGLITVAIMLIVKILLP
jgi:hypothetical protein